MWSPLFRTRPQLGWLRQGVMTPDGDELSLFRVAPTTSSANDHGRPLALLLHGLEGTLRSNYLPGLGEKLLALGFEVAVFLFRSCDGRPTVAPRLYHSGETSDLDVVVRALVSEAPDRPIVLHGVSLGANVLLKWMGERGDKDESAGGVPEVVRGAAVTSPPFDLTVSGPVLDRALGGLYTRRFLRTLVPKALAKAEQYPDLFDAEKVRAARTIEEFDTWATAPAHGFEDAWDYWRKCSSMNFLSGIERPTLLVASRDDPFNPGRTHPVELIAEQPLLVPAFTDRGGHVGFVMGAPWRTRHWSEDQVSLFLRDLVAED